MLPFAQATDALDPLIDRDQDFRLLGRGFGFTEGPAWNPPGNYLVFSDIPGDRRWRWSEQRGMELVAWPTYKGNGMAYEPGGSLLVCEQVTSSLIRIRPDGLRQVVACHYQGKYLNSPNDIVTHSDGSIWFTDPNYGRWAGDFGCGRENELDFQGVYRVPPGGGDCELVVPEGEFEQPLVGLLKSLAGRLVLVLEVFFQDRQRDAHLCDPQHVVDLLGGDVVHHEEQDGQSRVGGQGRPADL